MLQRQASPTLGGGASTVRSPTWQAQHLGHPAADAADVDAKEKSPTSRLHRFWQKYDAGNWALLACLIVLTICVDLIPPRHRFILNTSDPTLSFPLLTQTVPMWLLILLVIVTPLCVIISVFLLQRRQAHAKRELYFVAFGFCYSMVLTVLATDCIKRMAGRPRPNFLALSGLQNDGSFTGTPHDVSNAYQSFPSGHTSSAFAGLGYLSLYLFRLCFPVSFKSRELAQLYHINQGWKTIICLLPMALATWIGLTRITDYWHGFDDVSIGAILGLSIAAVTFQLHVGWWWTSLHGLENETTSRSVCAETGGIGGGGRMRANSREEPHYGLLTTPTGDNLASSDAQV